MPPPTVMPDFAEVELASRAVTATPRRRRHCSWSKQIEEIVARQVEAIKNLKIDKITVWDSGGGNGRGSSTAEFLSGMIKSLPPLHEVAGMAGVELPGYLGNSSSDEKTNGGSSHDGVSKWKAPPPAPTKQA